jgi:endonuclease G
MKFKHLLIYSLSAVVFVSCSKNNGNNFTFTPPVVDVADTSGSGTATPPSTITVGPDAPPANNDNSNLLFGNPSGAGTSITTDKDNYLINQGYYVESYNSTKLEPNWVSWHLDKSNQGTQKRLDNFAAYAGLPTGFVAVQSNSYVAATYGFDRGHNCPSADRTSSYAANSSTFLMTNMIPQAPNNNQQTWGNLEDYLRGLTSTNEVYIIMGSYGTGGTGSLGLFSKIGPLGVNVPSNVWKVAVVLPIGDGDLLRVTAATRVIVVNTPNINSISSNWKLYITSLQALETATGYKILSSLPTSVHDAIAPKIDPGS